MLKIKKVKKSEQDILTKLVTYIMPEDEFIFKGSHWWMVWDGDIPVGFAGISPSARWGNCGYLCLAGIKYSYRGLGLQKQLIKKRIEFAKRKGWDYVFTDTYFNIPSANSLISCGFKMYEPKDIYRSKRTTYWRRKI